MKKLLIVLALLGIGTSILAKNAESILMYHFDKARISPSDAGEPRLSEIDRDGIILWVARPQDGQPTILYFHGNAGNLANRTGRFSRFLDRGYGIVAMAYPGSSGSDGTQRASNFNTLAMRTYAELEQPVVLYGESLGTGVAVQLAATANIAPAAMVLEAPYSAIRDMAGIIYPQLGNLADRLPDLWPSKRLITQRDVPLLILHGSQDRVIPVEMGQMLFDLSPATDKQIHVVRGAGHNDVWQADAQRKLYRFIDRF